MNSKHMIKPNRIITREEAEDLIDSSDVISTSLMQENGNIEVSFCLANDQSFVVRYDCRRQSKSYHLKEA